MEIILLETRLKECNRAISKLICYTKENIMRKTLLFLTCVALVFGLSMPAQAFEIGVRVNYWFPGLSGDIKVDDSGLTGTKLDLESDLGFDEESYPVVEAFAGLGNHHLSLSYYKADYSGTNTNVDFNFAGQNFTGDISSDMEYDVFDIVYQYDFLDLENSLAGFSLGFVAKVKYFDGNFSIDGEVGGFPESESEDFAAPIPMVGLNLNVGIIADILELRVLATGSGYGGGTVLDGMADISLTLFPFTDIHGGYRVFTMDFDDDDVEFDFDTSGPYVAFTVSF
jgi:hypothetical protein